MKVRSTGRQGSEKEMKYLEKGRITKRYIILVQHWWLEINFWTNSYINCECNLGAALSVVLCTPTAYLKAGEVLNFPGVRRC